MSTQKSMTRNKSVERPPNIIVNISSILPINVVEKNILENVKYSLIISTWVLFQEIQLGNKNQSK